MAIGISPTVDFAFKLVLGSPEHPAVTIHFLNAVLAFWVARPEYSNGVAGRWLTGVCDPTQ